MKILVGYDGSDTAKDALKLAQRRAKNFGGEIEVIRSIAQSNELGDKDIQRANNSLDSDVWEIFYKNYLKPKTHLVLTKLSHGEKIVEFAKENKMDEIIIGVSRRSKVEKLLFGSTAQYVILNAPCPVVTVK